MFVRYVRGNPYVITAAWNAGMPRQLYLGRANGAILEAVGALREARRRGLARLKRSSACGRELDRYWRAAWRNVERELAKREIRYVKSEWRRRRVYNSPRGSKAVAQAEAPAENHGRPAARR